MLNLLTTTNIDIAYSDARHGFGLFETIKIRDGVPLRLDAHIKRLTAGTGFLGMDPPPYYEEVFEFLISRTNCTSLRSGVVRLMAVDRNLHVIVRSWEPSYPICIDIGLSNKITRFSRNMFTKFKTISYLDNRVMASEAESRSLYEVIALNENGHLTDGSRTNAFFVIDGRLVTPPVTDGALPGVVREILLDSKLACEAVVTVSDLKKVEAVALTNALHGILVVHHLKWWKENKLNATHPIVMDAIKLIT